MQSQNLTIKPLTPQDKGWALEWMAEQWGAPQIVVHGRVYQPHQLPGLVAWLGEEPAGLLTYVVEGKGCEIVTLNSLRQGQGVGTALIARVEEVAHQAGCKRVWLVTTNDNLNALAFYQKRGFRLVSIDRGAADRARRMKPDLPLLGEQGIPIHDEIELEKEV